MNKKILTITLNPAIDFSVEVSDFKIGYVNRGDSGRRDPGGKGINTATVTSRLGIPTAATGFLGNRNCSIFDEHFEKCLIKDEFIYINGNTREGLKITDRKNQLTTDINLPGFTVDAKSIDIFFDRFKELCPDYEYIIISGSLPEGLPSDMYSMLAETAFNAGAFTVVDTSGVSLRKVVQAGHVNLIKPNIYELLDAFMDPEDIKSLHSDESKLVEADKISRRLMTNVEMIALSLGASGSRLYTSNEIYEASAPEVDVATTVGAGDSFLGGLIAGFIFGKDNPGALQMASASAASALTKFGPGLSEKFPPGYFYDGVMVEKVR